MKRIPTIDLARGFTIFIMPSVHVALLYSNMQVKESMFVHILSLLAEWPGAQVFMLLMGISFQFSSRINRRSVLQRTFYLLLAAYLLNVGKFVLPFLSGFMPDGLLQELEVSSQNIEWLFLLGDILHFAAMAYLTCYFLYRYQYLTLFISILVIFVSPFVWDIHTGNPVIDYILALVGGQPPRVFFPLFPWLVYPLTGLFIGYYLKTFPADKIFFNAGMIGFILWFFGLINSTPGSFYRTTPADTICHVGFVLTWLCMWHWITKKIKMNFFFRLLIFLSKNITVIYIVQWILVFWCLAFTGYGQLNIYWSLIWMFLISFNSFLFPLLLKQPYEKKYHL